VPITPATIDEVAAAVAVHVAERLAVELGVDPVAQVADEGLADALEQPFLHGAEENGAAVHADHHQKGRYQEVRLVLGEDVVDDEHPYEGVKDVGGGGEHHAEQAKDELPPVRTKLAEEPSGGNLDAGRGLARAVWLFVRQRHAQR
jgi:hypothetical protein